MKLEVGKRYTIKDTYKKPDKKYFRGVPNISTSALRGRTLKCRKLSATGMSAWFNYQGEDFWVKSTSLKQAPDLPKTRKVARGRITEPKMKGKSFLITKPERNITAFWVPGMNQYVGQVATVIEEGPSKWVRVHVDNGGYMWNKDWLKPVSAGVGVSSVTGKGTMKVRKLSLQEELMAIDARYDAKIRNIKYSSNVRQHEMARKAQDYKNYLARDKTQQNMDKYIAKGKITVTKTSWKSKLYNFACLPWRVLQLLPGRVLPALAVSAAAGGIVYGALTLL